MFFGKCYIRFYNVSYFNNKIGINDPFVVKLLDYVYILYKLYEFQHNILIKNVHNFMK